MKNSYVALVVFALAGGIFLTASAQNVGINTTGATPNAAAILDLNTGNAGTKGFLPEQVPLTNVTVWAPLTGAATVGMLVYSTAAPTGGSGVGYYYWGSNAKWNYLLNAASNNSTAWLTTGNAGTLDDAALAGNFVGTTDNIPLDFRVNNLHAGRVDANGNAFYGYQSGNNASYALAGGHNSALGYQSLNANSSGTSNVAVGYQALLTNTTGTNNTALGFLANVGAAGLTNATAIGNRAYVTANNSLVLGSINGINGAAAFAFTGIGYTSPPFLFSVGANAAGNPLAFVNNGSATGGAIQAVNSAVAGAGVGYGILAGSQQSGGATIGAELGNPIITYYTGTAISGNIDASVLGIAVAGVSNNAGGTGVAGAGNGQALTSLVGGTGGSFVGSNYGLYADAFGPTIDAAIICQNASDGNQVDIAYFDGITSYKIIGSVPGLVSMSVKNTNGDYVVMHAPETPECYFEDYGEAQLSNGKVHVSLDPTFAKNICVNQKHPLRVYIQPEGDCKGVYVTNKTNTGFDVVELNGGTSNISFQYHIIGNMADAVMPSGVTSKFADLRFEPAPKQLQTETHHSATSAPADVNGQTLHDIK